MYMQSTSYEMPGWMKHKLESRLLGKISITSDMQMTPPLWSINLKQKRRIYNGKKIISSISGARKIGELHAEDSS